MAHKRPGWRGLLDAGDGPVTARGAAVQVPLPLTFTCPEDWRYGLEISVVEASGTVTVDSGITA